MADTDYSYLSLRMMIYGAAQQFDSEPEDRDCYGSTNNNYPFIYKLETNFSKFSSVKLNKILYVGIKLIYFIHILIYFI